MRVYHESGVFYRFCWCGPLLYISSWSSVYREWNNKAEILSRAHTHFNAFASNPIKYQKQDKLKVEPSKKRRYEEISSEYVTAPNDMLLLQKGEEYFRNMAVNKTSKKNLEKELKRLKKVKQILNI